ncbi:hypothetical protein [Psychrobacter phenylpyruvicus]|uniref:Type IV secretion protein Rhs n=1 Tax=Psychrobacter phenylpyruvicus TaxID=29432 RepID=A0A379LGW3_9GAMM|nr:hypothetical protein [Psychrobacter phenylpyruvicus]SUD89796.1 Uncharacterised protein [Psychrobacter phenylpyruvicus]
MAQREINCGNYRLTRADSSGHKCVSVPTKRVLTPGEIAMATKVFANSIDYSIVYIHNEEYLPFGWQKDNTIMTPDGELYYPKGHYKSDYSTESNNYKHLFIHEMVHVWQYQLGYNVKWEGACLHLNNMFGGSDPYPYVLDTAKKLCDYNMEQQGDIIADYFVYYCLSLPLAQAAAIVSDSGYRNRNNRNEYLVVLSDFLSDPSNTTNLPNS